MLDRHTIEVQIPLIMSVLRTTLTLPAPVSEFVNGLVNESKQAFEEGKAARVLTINSYVLDLILEDRRSRGTEVAETSAKRRCEPLKPAGIAA
jgi:hypothetical protein